MGITTTTTIGDDIYFSTDAGFIYSWDIVSGSVREVMRTGLPLTDIAFAPDGELYGITSNKLYRLNQSTDTSSLIGDLDGAITPFISGLDNATGFSISQSGEARISSDNLSVVAVVDLLTGQVSNGGSLGQGRTSPGDILHDDNGYWATTAYTLLGIVPGTYGEVVWENQWVGATYYGLAAAPTGLTGLDAGEILGFKDKSVYRVEDGNFGLISYQDFSITGNITGAAQIIGGSSVPTGPGTQTFPLVEEFDDGILNGGNWSYRDGPRVEESGGALNIFQDRTDDGGRATYTLGSPIDNAEISLKEYHHAANAYYFGNTGFTFVGADGEEFSILYRMLRSSYGPDYDSNSANFDRPKLQTSSNGNFYDSNNSTSSLLDQWVDTKISVDNTKGTISIDNLGDGVIDIVADDAKLIGAKLVDVRLDGYGWWTGHYRKIDRFELDQNNGTVPEPPADSLKASEIFEKEGKLAFLSQLALAAYHLESRETIGDKLNDLKVDGEKAYKKLDGLVELLDGDDLLNLNYESTKFGINGISGGIYNKDNAAALVTRASDAVFLSFRGTNDNEGEAGYPANTPDERHWSGLVFNNKNTHFKKYKALIDSLSDYMKSEGLTKLYVTGHSLGGGMVEGFMDKKWVQEAFAGVSIEAMTFASPGYGVALFASDSRISNFWIDGDPILGAASASGDNEGDFNMVYHNLKHDDYLHSMKLYSQVAKYIESFDIEFSNFNELEVHGIDYDSVFVSLIHTKKTVSYEGKDYETDKFIVGRSNEYHSPWGAGNDLILGSNKRDELYGFGGRDHIEGGEQVDNLSGGNGGDFLFGGRGGDTLSGGWHKDFLSGGRGSDTLTGGRGNDTFFFKKGDGNDVITDFKLGKDTIQIGKGANGFGKLTVSASGDDAVVAFSDVTITLTKIAATDITKDLFEFV